MFCFFTHATLFFFFCIFSPAITLYHLLFSQLYSESSHKSSSSWIFAVCIIDRYNSSMAVISLYWQTLNFIWRCVSLRFTLTIDLTHSKYRKLIIYFSCILKYIEIYVQSYPFLKYIFCSALEYKLSEFSQILQWNIFIAGKLGSLTP